MKKRLLSGFMALIMCLSLLPASAIPALAAPINAKPGGAEYSGEIDDNVYQQLGLKLDAKESDASAPYSKDHTTSAFEAREVYVAANGAKQNVYTLRDGFDRLDTDMKQDDNNTDDNLPGSPRNGAYEYYKHGNGCINPEVNTGNGYKIDSDLSSNKENSILTEAQGFSGIYATSTAFDRGNGKDDCVAELRAWGENKSTAKKSGVNPWDRKLIGKVEVDVFHINDNGYRENISTLALPVTADMCIGTNNGQDYKYRYLDREFVQNLDGIFEIEAADMDGDGIDELFVYDGYTYESGNNRMAKVHVYTANSKYGSYYKWKDVEVNAGAKDNYVSRGMHGIPNVTMASGDLDRDGRDEVAITASTGGGSSSFDGNVKIVSGSSMTTLKEFSLRGTESGDYMAYPNVTFGSFNLPETSIMSTVMIVAGYNGVLSDGFTTQAAYRYFYLDPTSGTDQWRLSPYIKTWMDTDSTGAKIARSWNNEDSYGHGKTLNRAPFPLACANLDGVSNEPAKASDELFFGGDVYNFGIVQKVETDDKTGMTTVTLGDGLGQKIKSAALYINQKHDGNRNKAKGQVWISDVQSGIIDSDPKKQNYRETFIYSAGVHRRASSGDEDYYWMDIGVVGKKNDGQGTPYSAEEGVICHGTVHNNKYGTYISLALPDIQDDSVLLKFKKAYTVYTNPEVYAILQASPYFMDLNDTHEYIGNGGTSYGISTTNGVSNGGGFHQSVGVYHSAEVQAFAGGEYEVELSTDFSYEYAMSHEVEHAVSYNAQGGSGDMVVVYAVPYVYYWYDMYNPITKEWGATIMPVPLTPTTSVISVDQYDEIATHTAGLDLIRGEVLHSTPGAPETYQNQPSGTRIYTSKGDGKSSFIGINSSGAGSDVTQEINVTDGKEHSTSVSMDLNYKVGGGASFLGESVYVGVTGSTGAGFSNATSSSKGTSFSGTVDGLPEDAQDYGFSWRLIVNQAQLNGAPVWVVGYEIVDVYQPPRMPRNVHVTKTTTDTMDIAWDSSGGAAYYDIYMETSTGERNKIASVPYTVTEYHATELYSNRAYSFCVQAVSDQGATSIISAPARGTTMSREAEFTITKDPESVSSENPVGVGKSHTFSAGAEMTIAGKPISLNYQWEYQLPGSEDWIQLRNGGGVSGANTTTLTLSGVSELLNGRSYRCKVYHYEDTLYTKSAKLYVGKEASQVALSGVTDGQTVNASGTLPSTEMVEQTVPANVFLTQGEKTYSLYSVLTKAADKENPAEYANYWKDNSGKFYAAKGDIQRSEDGFVTGNVTYADNVGDEISPVVTQQASVTYEKGKETVTETVDLTPAALAEPAPATVVAGKTYTAVHSWTGTVNGKACTFHEMTWTDEKDSTTDTIFRYVDDEAADTYLAYLPTSVTTVDGRDPNGLTAAQRMVTRNIPVPTTKPVEGQTVTLTAKPALKNGTPLKEGKVFFAINGVNGLTTIPAQLQTDGSYTAQWTPATEGKVTVKAVYEGSRNYQRSESAPVTLNAVIEGHDTLALTVPASVTYNTAADLTVTKLIGTAKPGSAAPVTAPVYKVEKLLENGTYAAAEADKDYTLTGNSFTPKLVTSFRITAADSSEAGALTDTRILRVEKAVLTLKATDTEISLDETTVDRQPKDISLWINEKPAGDDVSLARGTVKDQQLVGGDYALESKGTTASSTGEYPIYVRINEDSIIIKNIRKFYEIQTETAAYTVTKDQVTVNAVAGANGSVRMSYAKDSESLAQIPVQSGSKLPVGCKVTVNAFPDTGYKVSSWTVNGNKLTAGDKFVTKSPYVIKALAQTTNIQVEFEAAKSKLTYVGDAYGDVYGNYMNGTVLGDRFTSGSNVNYTQTVRITAQPKPGYVVDHWTVQKGSSDPEIILAVDGKSSYTGTTYDFTQFSEDMKVTVFFTSAASFPITIAPTAADGTFLSGAVVTVGGKPLTDPVDGKYTYNGGKGENLTITVTPPDGLLVDRWDVKDGQTTGSLSERNRTMTIYNLSAPVDFTVRCAALNSYPVTFGGVMADESGFTSAAGSVTAALIGSGPISSGDSKLQGSTVEITAAPAAGYEVVGWTRNGEAVEPTKTDSATGKQTVQVSSLNQAENITAAFLAKPTVTFPASDAQGAVAVSADKVDGAAKNLSSGDYVDFGADLTVTVKPAVGFRVNTPIVNGTDATGVTETENSDDKTFTLTDIDADQTLAAGFEAIPSAQFTFSVVDKAPEDKNAGLDGTLTVSVARKDMDGYKVENSSDTQTVYSGSQVTFTAEPAEGYKVGTWFVDGVDQKTAVAPSFTTRDDSVNHEVTVRFDPVGSKIVYGFLSGEDAFTDKATLSGSFLAQGSDKPRDFATDAIPATNGKLTVSVNGLAEGYEVENWYVDGVPKEPAVTDSALTVDVTANVGQNIRVKIIRSSYQVDFTAVNGAVTAGDLTTGTLVKGDTSITFTAKPVASGYTFSGWYVNGMKDESTGETLTLTVTAPLVVEARYTMDVVTYPVNFGVVGDNGTLTVTPDLGEVPAEVAAGKKLTFTAAPAEGYQVKGWYTDADGSTALAGTASEQLIYTVESLTAPANVFVAFEPIPEYVITVNTQGKGSVTAQVNGKDAALADGKLTVKRHDAVILTAVPDADHHLTAWTLDSADQGNSSLTLTLNDVTGAHTATAAFASSQRVMLTTKGSVISKAGFGDALETIDASSGIQLETGKNVVITANLASDRMVKSWTVNGVPVTKTNMAQFGMTHPLDTVLKISGIREEMKIELTDEPIQLFTLPTTQPGYTVTIDSRLPELPGSETEIRKGGDVVFTVTPDANSAFKTLTVNGVDCLKADALPEGMTVTDNKNGSYTVSLTDVQKNVVLNAQTMEYSVVVTELDLDDEGMAALVEKFGSKENVEKELRKAVSALDSKLKTVKLLDIQVLVSINGGDPVPVEEFPANGFAANITHVILGSEYDKALTFGAIRMNASGEAIGQTQEQRISADENGVTVMVTGSAPFAIAWGKEEKKPPMPGGGGGLVVTEEYEITVNASYNGSVESDKETAAEDDTVTLTAKADQGKELASIVVTTESGKEIVPQLKNGKYVFTMPGENVTVRAAFRCSGDEFCPTAHLKDNPVGTWYHDAVDFVVHHKIMNGVSSDRFAPDMSVSRSMVVTILYNLEGKPETHAPMTFRDVAENAWYCEPVRWAAANGIVAGYSADQFGPDDAITREQMAVILNQYARFKGLELAEGADLSRYEDMSQVSTWASEAMAWANAEYLIRGVSDAEIQPQGETVRAQAAIIIQHFCENHNLLEK